MKVLIASPEVYPFVKTGGLADVTGSLPKALKKLGVDARVILPKHKQIGEKFPLRYHNWKISCPISNRIVEAEIIESQYDEIIAYLIEKDEYFYRDYLYSTPDGDYLDNAERFAFFSKAILEAIKITGFIPDVLHLNDWETALSAMFLKVHYKDDPLLRNVATLLTIHNLGYQGIFWHYDMHLLNLGWEFFTSEYLEFYGKINFLKGGIIFADIINTVSKKYSQEIQTPEFGFGLDGVLKKRASDLFGVVNGIDYEEWNPETDTKIPYNYGPDRIENKKLNKIALQKTLGLPVTDKPLIATISRLSEQKGLDLIIQAIPDLVNFDVQYVILGTGERKFHEDLEELKRTYPESIGLKIGYDDELAHLIEAGADIFLLASRYEPCGLNQLYSLKYGTVPVVRAVGGLDDTIVDYSENPSLGTGFKFSEYSKEALLSAIRRALSLYSDKTAWRQLIKRCMLQDFSWERSAREYIKLYKLAIERHGSR
ncbi:MAG: glycogen synthase GlgA [Desulfobacterota bacterium]|nr:glycogen synthase GlgA [Thermodesulfobacteriota bacterium]MDW8001695.1 glycogen synthase GlgA [Deltaproteobacteria bacterium]